jgi:hypothetical protein
MARRFVTNRFCGVESRRMISLLLVMNNLILTGI